MDRRRALMLFSGMLFSAPASMACLWDTDTLKDESRSQPGVIDLVLGQFAHHGDAYYQLRIDRLLKEPELDIAQSNDLAVAYVRLAEFDKAKKVLLEVLKQHPEHYETLSNLGVLEKKSGNFKAGAEYIGKALSQKAGGHMGLGDWYLRALVWRTKYENATGANAPEVCFMGESYAELFVGDGYGEGRRRKPRRITNSRQAKMVRNDQSFADGFLVLGDYLRKVGNLELAFVAHTRAHMLGHQNVKELERRRAAYLKYAKTLTKGDRYVALEVADAERLIHEGLAWLEAFKKMEATLLSGLDDERKVTFGDVEKALAKAGVRKASL